MNAYAGRVRLTWEEAERGVKPPPYSRDEWAAMNAAVDAYADAELRARFHRAFPPPPAGDVNATRSEPLD